MERVSSKSRYYVLGIHADPPPLLTWCYRLAPFVTIAVIYYVASSSYLAANPDGKILPSFGTMARRAWELTFVRDIAAASAPLWSDTVASISRLGIGVLMAAIFGLFGGVTMAMFPGVRLLTLPLITSLSVIPTLALLPILLIVFGIGGTAKVTLIFVGVAFNIARDIYAATSDVPRELVVKAQTLGASDATIAYRIALPLIMPRLIDAVRQSLGPAWLFLIAGESIASTEGLGYRIFLQRRYLDMATIIPYVAWITILAYLIDRGLAFLRGRLFPWKQ